MRTVHHRTRGTRICAAIGAAALAVGLSLAAAPAASAATGQADLGVTLTGPTHVPNPGSQYSLTATVHNYGPDTATGVTFSVAGLVGQPGASEDSPYCTLGAQSLPECSIPSLAAGQSVTVHYQAATPNQDTEFTSSILDLAMASPQSDPGQFNDQASVHTVVGDGNNPAADSADLALTKTGPETTAPGAPVTYEITVTNNGPDDSAGYTVTDALPAGLTNPTTSTPGCSITSGTLTCTSSNTLASGIHDVYQVTGTAPQSGQLSNTASVAGVTADPTPGNNSDTVVTTIDAPAADPSGDWGTTGSDVMAPGTGASYDQSFTCMSAAGCDYTPGLTITDHAAHGGFGTGTNTVYLNGQTAIGTCTVTSSDIDCEVTATGHANQGDTISTAGIAYNVTGTAPPNTQVFAITLTPPTGWTGDDASNNVFPISTPPEAGAPMVSWQAGAGIGGVALLLGGAFVLMRRRKAATAPLGAQ